MRNPKINYQGKKLYRVNPQILRKYYYLADKDMGKAVAMSKATQHGPHQYIGFFGKKMTLNQIAKIYGIKREVLQRAYDATSDIDEAITLCINNCPIIKYKQQKDTVSIHKLKNLAYTFDDTTFKVDHTLLNNELDPIAIVEDKMLNENLKRVLQALPEPKQQVLRLRYGIDDGISRTLEEIGHLFGVNKEWIRQIESQEIRRLKHSRRVKYFNGLRECDWLNEDKNERFVSGIKKELSSFSLSEQRLLCLLYGLADGRYHSYPEIAKKFGLSVDRIKMLEKNLIGRLDNFSLSYFERYRTELALNSGKERI